MAENRKRNHSAIAPNPVDNEVNNEEAEERAIAGLAPENQPVDEAAGEEELSEEEEEELAALAELSDDEPSETRISINPNAMFRSSVLNEGQGTEEENSSSHSGEESEESSEPPLKKPRTG